MSARSDGDHVPSARCGEYQRSGSCTGRQSRLPDLASVAGVERAKVVVERRADEHEARLRGCRTAEIRRAGRCTGAGQSFLAKVTQRHPPSNFAAFRVDRKSSPKAERCTGRRKGDERLTRHGVGRAILLGGFPRRESLPRPVNCALGSRRMMAGQRLTGAMSRRWRASSASPPQCRPPMLPGTRKLPRRLGGVKMPSLRSAPSRRWQASRSSGVAPHRSFSVKCCGARSRRFRGKGLSVSGLFSVHIAGGTARSTIGKSDRPVDGRTGTDGGPSCPRQPRSALAGIEQRRRGDI